jgi:hypothetical protein
LLAEIKARVQSARIKAGLAANRELLALYWDIGRLILDRQKQEGWGPRVIDRLAIDLQREFPGQQGFSPRNLKYMRAFAEAWPETAIVQRPVAQLDKPLKPPSVKAESVIVQAPLAQLPRLNSWRRCPRRSKGRAQRGGTGTGVDPANSPVVANSPVNLSACPASEFGRRFSTVPCGME